MLEGGGDVERRGIALSSKPGGVVEHRGLQAGKTEIIAVRRFIEHDPRVGDGQRVARFREAVDGGTAGPAFSEVLGDLIEGLPAGVVQRAPEDLQIEGATGVEQKGVPTGDEEDDVRPVENPGQLETPRVGGKVVDRDEGFSPGEGQAAGRGEAD